MLRESDLYNTIDNLRILSKDKCLSEIEKDVILGAVEAIKNHFPISKEDICRAIVLNPTKYYVNVLVNPEKTLREMIKEMRDNI